MIPATRTSRSTPVAAAIRFNLLPRMRAPHFALRMHSRQTHALIMPHPVKGVSNFPYCHGDDSREQTRHAFGWYLTVFNPCGEFDNLLHVYYTLCILHL
jgi:hypothetical protein